MINTRCIYCRYWQTWEDLCVNRKSERYLKFTPGLTRACELYEPDDGEGNNEIYGRDERET